MSHTTIMRDRSIPLSDAEHSAAFKVMQQGLRGVDDKHHARWLRFLREVFALVIAGALAKLGEPDVAILAELNSGSDQHAVDLDTGLTLEFEEHVDYTHVCGPAAQDPAAAAHNGPGQGANQPRGFDDGDGLHLKSPGDSCRS